jgi:hypothetical protein
MRGLGDEIAVLDGLDEHFIPAAYSMQNVLDASAGANYSGGSSFAPGLPLLPSNAGLAGLDGVNIPNAYSMQNVLDASAGGNYSGGSSFAPGLPLLPSNAGLASTDDDLLSYYQDIQKGAYNAGQVIDASAGANYSGGSSFAPGLPLLPSNAGLAGTYDGKPLDQMDHYWGSTMGVDQNAYDVQGVLDASGGANYSGGSSYAPGLPLLPSNAGLAGLDAVSDRGLTLRISPARRNRFLQIAGKKALQATKANFARLKQIAQKPMTPAQKQQVQKAMRVCMGQLFKQRVARAQAARGVTSAPAAS